MVARVVFLWVLVVSFAHAQAPALEAGSAEAFSKFQEFRRSMADAQSSWESSKKLGVTPAGPTPRDQHQCLDPRELTNESRGYLEYWQYSILDIAGPRDMILSIANPSIPPVWLTDYPTSDLADGDQVRIVGRIEVAGTKTYDTVAGSSKTVRVIKFVTAEREKQIAAEESAKLDAYLTRTWVDSTGAHRTLGKFLEFKNGKAHIERKPDGKLLSVQLSKLSDGDQKWIRDELKRRKEESKKQTVPESVPAIAH